MNNVIIDALGALVILIIQFSNRAAARDARPLARMIRLLMTCCVAVFLLDIPGLLLDGRAFPGALALIWFFDTAYWVAHIAYLWLWLVFVDLWCFSSIKNLWRRAGPYALPAVCELALIALNPWTGWLFVIDANHMYAPGSAYQLCLLPHYAYLAASLALVCAGARRAKDISGRRRCASFLAYLLLPACGAAMELLAYGVSWVWPMIALSLLMIYLSEQQRALAEEQLSIARSAETAARMQAQLTQSRIAIMLSQIQPHFLYNALCVIQELCHGKAPEAETATIAFSRFLRYNMDSLRADSPIPFLRELSHTQYYLTLEGMRFGERLKVEYDLRADGFSLPALTLQPITENAVRYGVMKKERGGTVRITTRETESAYVVTVEDDGVGFDPYRKHEDGRTHIGIENVRQRLREMCAGELDIRSQADKGTIATLTLPKGAHAHENPGD